MSARASKSLFSSSSTRSLASSSLWSLECLGLEIAFSRVSLHWSGFCEDCEWASWKFWKWTFLGVYDWSLLASVSLFCLRDDELSVVLRLSLSWTISLPPIVIPLSLFRAFADSLSAEQILAWSSSTRSPYRLSLSTKCWTTAETLPDSSLAGTTLRDASTLLLTSCIDETFMRPIL